MKQMPGYDINTSNYYENIPLESISSIIKEYFFVEFIDFLHNSLLDKELAFFIEKYIQNGDESIPYYDIEKLYNIWKKTNIIDLIDGASPSILNKIMEKIFNYNNLDINKKDNKLYKEQFTLYFTSYINNIFKSTLPNIEGVITEIKKRSSNVI